MIRWMGALAVGLIAGLVAASPPALAQSQPQEADEAADKYVDYYYPPITSTESFTRELPGAPPAGRQVRVGFVTQITKAQLADPSHPQYVMFAKGTQADKLIIVALDDQVFGTLFRARAVLAQLTSNARGTDFFIQNNLHTHGTFLDLVKLFDFQSVTISDGRSWTHQITLN